MFRAAAGFTLRRRLALWRATCDRVLRQAASVGVGAHGAHDA